jgi:crotonobetainyl-CoA:carnitine CoA-transferase CaiB-like acyl-CoA transferase
VRVLDLSSYAPGPVGGQLLGDFGAEVIKIERPQRGDPVRGGTRNGFEAYGSEFIACNRNKKSLTLDLKKPQAKEILYRLAEKADVMISSSRPGSLERMGFGYADLSARNPRLIYATMTSFGSKGGWSDAAVQDLEMQALSGLASSTHYEGLPVPLGYSLSYTYSGVFLAMGVTIALAAREATGRGQIVDGSMFAPALVADIVNATGALNGLPRDHRVETADAAAAELDAAQRAQVTRRNNMVVEIAHPRVGAMKLYGIPIVLSETPGRMAMAPPMLGEHNTEVLRDLLGYTPGQIEELKKEDVIGE